MAGLETLLSTPRYDASADILIQPLDSGDTTFQGMSLFRQSLDGSSTAALAARVLGSPGVAHKAYTRLGEHGKGVSFNITPLSQATIVTVQASAANAAAAAFAANTYANAAVKARTSLFQSELKARIARLAAQAAAVPATNRSGNFVYASLEQQLGTLEGLRRHARSHSQVMTLAFPPGAAAWPRPKLSIGIALIVALLLGGGVAVALEVFSPRVTREEELTLGHRLPVLARIPRLPRARRRSAPFGRWSSPRQRVEGLPHPPRHPRDRRRAR